MTHEEQLIRQIQKGRRECLDELIELYYPAILRYCLWHMPDAESAQDATQETFLKLMRFIGRYEHRGQFKAFLYRIAANTCTDIRRRLPSPEPFSDELASVICRPESGYQEAEDRQLLAAAFAILLPFMPKKAPAQRIAARAEITVLKFFIHIPLRPPLRVSVSSFSVKRN